jgi:aryl carrier-like protein
MARLLMLPASEREAAVIGQLERRVREVMRLATDRALPPTLQLADLGFDSLMATELKTALLADGLDVPLGRLLGGPSLEELAMMVVARLPAADAEATAMASASAHIDDEPDRTLIWTHLAAVLVGIGIASGVWLLL